MKASDNITNRFFQSGIFGPFLTEFIYQMLSIILLDVEEEHRDLRVWVLEITMKTNKTIFRLLIWRIQLVHFFRQ